jgi:hypothetical protein
LTVLRNECKAFLEGRKVKEPQEGSTRRKKLRMKIVNVEERMFKVYLKTGKSKKRSFPFEMIGKVFYTKEDESRKIAEVLFDVGWSPEIHVSKTRRKYENIYYIDQRLTF